MVIFGQWGSITLELLQLKFGTSLGGHSGLGSPFARPWNKSCGIFDFLVINVLNRLKT